MIVRVHFGPGRLVTQRKGKNVRAARLLASVMTLTSVSFGIFGFWRLAQDLDLAGNFVFQSGLLSHWQVWMAATAVTSYFRWRLTRYSRTARRGVEELIQEEPIVQKVSAGV